MTESDRIDRRFNAALAKIRRDGVFALDPWATSYVVPVDPGEYPTLREIRAIPDDGADWKANGGSVLRRGRRKRPADQKCSKCQKELAITKRRFCHKCIYQARCAKGWRARRNALRRSRSDET